MSSASSSSHSSGHAVRAEPLTTVRPDAESSASDSSDSESTMSSGWSSSDFLHDRGDTSARPAPGEISSATGSHALTLISDAEEACRTGIPVGVPLRSRRTIRHVPDAGRIGWDAVTGDSTFNDSDAEWLISRNIIHPAYLFDIPQPDERPNFLSSHSLAF